jgi:uncharacterized membrane protein YeaQ/YmgE (transglycosylase-associated protein family)
MNIQLDDVVSWLIVGALAGSLAGMLVKRRKEGFGHILNLGIGTVGALIGGFLFKVLKINLGLLGSITVSAREVVAGFIGSLVFLGLIWTGQKYWPRRKTDDRMPPRK